MTLPNGGGYVDRLLFTSTDDRRDASHLNADGQASAAFSRGVMIVEAKQWTLVSRSASPRIASTAMPHARSSTISKPACSMTA
jgi:hypothetical protein